MNFAEIKLYSLNTSALFISMTNVDSALKIILLLVSIGYTLNRWFIMRKENKINK